jgi:hypothetical protein
MTIEGPKPLARIGMIPLPLAVASASTKAAVFACVVWLACPSMRAWLSVDTGASPMLLLLTCMVSAAVGSLMRRHVLRGMGMLHTGLVPLVLPATLVRVAVLCLVFSVEAMAAVSLVLGLAASVSISPDELSFMFERAGLPGLALCATCACSALVLERLCDVWRLRPGLLAPSPMRRPIECGIPHALRRRLSWTLVCLGVMFCLGLTRHAHGMADLGLLAASILLGTGAVGARNCLDASADRTDTCKGLSLGL